MWRYILKYIMNCCILVFIHILCHVRSFELQSKKKTLVQHSPSVFSCVGAVWWISMSTTNNIAQARKLVEQLRIEAGIERIKVGWYFTVMLVLCAMMHPHLTALSSHTSPSSFYPVPPVDISSIPLTCATAPHVPPYLNPSPSFPLPLCVPPPTPLSWPGV